MKTFAEIDGDLAEVEAYFDNRADADHDGLGYVPNEEMRLLTLVQELRADLRRAIGQDDASIAATSSYIDAGGKRRTNIMGYFDDPAQTVAAFDPGLDVVCPVCLDALQVPLVTISLMVPGDNRSFFFRAHKACWDGASEEERSHVEGALVDARAALAKPTR